MTDEDRKRVEQIRDLHATRSCGTTCHVFSLLAILDRQCVATPEDVERVTRAVRGHVEYAKQARAALRAMGFEVAE